MALAYPVLTCPVKNSKLKTLMEKKCVYNHMQWQISTWRALQEPGEAGGRVRFNGTMLAARRPSPAEESSKAGLGESLL